MNNTYKIKLYMVEIGTVLTPVGKKALLCGSGEQ